MVSLREHGEYLRLAIAMALLDESEVIAWADSEIAQSGCPSAELIDISMADPRARDELIKLLCALPGSADYEAAAHRVLGLLRAKLSFGEVSLRFAVRALEAYCSWARVSEKEGFLALSFDDAMSCADHGYYGTEDSVRADVEEFLRKYGSNPEAGLTTGHS
jgi:hypothetical protein